MYLRKLCDNEDDIFNDFQVWSVTKDESFGFLYEFTFWSDCFVSIIFGSFIVFHKYI